MSSKRPSKISRYLIETYGCEMNIAESNSLEMQLKGIGLEKAETPDEADLVVLNTCSVRKSAENRIWGRLSLFAKEKTKHPLILIVTGCMAERIREELKAEAPFIDYVFGTNEKFEIVNIAQGRDAGEDSSYEFVNSYYKEGDVSTFVPIMNGCNNFCTYCIVPYTRGREVSRPLQEVLKEVQALPQKGVKEITLLGQNVNSYHYVDEQGNVITFPQLLKEVCKVADGIEWIRFESPHPKDFSDELIRVIAEEEKVAKHLHIPLQSGSSRILRLMNRRYDREHFIRLIEKLREATPSITFSTDVMVGFPSETEEDFLDTMSVVEFMRCTEAFMYYWNPREGTKAVTMEGQLSVADKKARLARLIERQQEIFHAEKTKLATGVHKLLVTKVSRDDENQLLGRGENNEMVAFNHFENCQIGSIVHVAYTDCKGNTIIGHQVEEK